MYDRKTYLYFALAIVGFLIWNAWQKDYGTTSVVTAAKVAPANQAPPVAGSLPPSSEKIPEAVATKDRTIQVKTDTFDATIDKQGGNIVSIKLPKYPVAYETPQIPVTLLTENPANYYAAQSGVLGKDGTDTSKVMFTSSQSSYQMTPEGNDLNVVLTWKGNGIEVKKNYIFKKGHYDIIQNQTVTNTSSKPWVGNIYGQIKRRGLTEETSMFGLHTYTGAGISSPQTPYEKLSYSKMDKENLNRPIKDGWLAMQQRYFVSALVPKTDDTLRYYSQVTPVGPSDKPLDKVYTLGYETPDINIPANQSVSQTSKFYSGPEIAENLKQVAPHLDLVIDYGWFWIFSGPIFKVMETIYHFVGNWGVAIILVTVLIKLLFYKLSETSYRSMARMRNLQPKILALKDKFGDDRQKLSQATMELYRKEKVNPLGGCLPMIVQIPVFIALYYVLIESVQLRQAPFIFWIHDLSVKDPFYVLPVLMGLSWMLQQKLNPPPPDPVQAKLMMLFPVIFTVLFATFPAGLVLYWIVNNCLSILQQWYIMRRVENEGKKPLTKKSRVSSSR